MSWPNRGAVHRPVVMGRRGMVASAHPSASAAGLRILQEGGNAIDAAVAVAATLNVVEPYMSGIGGNGYMLVYSARERRLRVLDYMASAPAAANPADVPSQEEFFHSPKSMLIPGAVGGWLTALETYGTLDRAAVFRPAIEHAEGGVPISLKNAYFYQHALEEGHLTPEMRAIYFPDGATPTPGSVIAQPQLARTFRELVAGGQEAFYRGELARRVVRAIRHQGGWIDEADFAGYQPEWREPVSTDYRGYTIACPPPPCSGIQYLQTLNILEGFDLAASGHNTTETIHRFAEAMKLAVADRIAYAPTGGDLVPGLLSKTYAAERRAMFDSNRARISQGERFSRIIPTGSVPPGERARLLRECTTHFDVVDGHGNAVSVTQSLGDGFGSGFLAGDAGFLLNNLGFWFDVDPESPNALGSGRRIEMCMSPAAVFRDDALFMVIGTPGSFGILQTTPQMISNVIDYGFSIQAAIEAPRFRTYEGTTIEIEARIPKATRDELEARGHHVRLIDDWSFLVGGGQGILIDPETGVRMGGADPRRDGYAIGW